MAMAPHTFKEIDEPKYRLNEIDEARERIAGRFYRKIEVVREISKLRAELYLSEMEDAADRYLIRELNKSPYSSLKAYFRGETRNAPEIRN